MFEIESFISCDWGTTNLRLRYVEESGHVISSIESPDGILKTFENWKASSEERDSYYLRVIQKELKKLKAPIGLPVVISGMVGSNLGLKELPYVQLPFQLNGEDVIVEKLEESECDYYLISGVRSENDIMRGEETQLVGLNHMGVSDNWVIIPGTHSKHCKIKERTLLDLRTYMTGEIFSLLLNHSSLKNTLAQPEDTGNQHERSFLKGLDDSQDSDLLNQIFSPRVDFVLGRRSKEENSAYLSGLLIGSELNSIAKSADSITILSDDELGKFYQKTLNRLGFLNIQMTSVEEATITGQAAILNYHKKP